VISIERYQKRYSLLRVLLALTVSLLAIPYLVDVGYMEDQTPTHSAQETLSDKDDIGEGDVFLAFGPEQDHAVAMEPAVVPPTHHPVPPDIFQDRTVAPIEYLNIASLISRPPPSV
jgi:hypothetical protein